MDLDRMISCGSLNAKEMEGNKTTRPTEPTTSLRNVPPDPPRHTPRPPRSPPATSATVDLDYSTACSNHNVKAKEGNKCKSRGSLHNTRTYPNRRRDRVAPHPRTLRKGNPGDFPQLYRLDDEYFSPTATSTQRREVEGFHLEILLPDSPHNQHSKPPPHWTRSAYTQLKQQMPINVVT